MSIKVMSQVWEYNWEPIPHLILLALADWADDRGGKIFPSVSTVARKCKVSERTVQRVFADLRKSGVLVVVKQARAQHPAEYRLDLYRGDRMTPLTDENERGDSDGGVTVVVERGDSPDVPGVTDVTPNTSVIHQKNHQIITAHSSPQMGDNLTPLSTGDEKKCNPIGDAGEIICAVWGMPPLGQLAGGTGKKGDKGERGAICRAAQIMLANGPVTETEVRRRKEEYERRFGRLPLPVQVASMWAQLSVSPVINRPAIRNFNSERAQSVVDNAQRVKEAFAAMGGDD